MKTLRMFAVGIMFAALFAVSAFAQTGATPASGTGKIAVINTGFFGDPKEGIKKYTAALDALDNEFKPVQTELTTMQTKLQGLSKEIQTLQEQASKPGAAPINQSTIQGKVDEGERLQLDLKRKQEDAKARFEKRQQTLMAPIMADIYKAYSEYQKKNGYLLILDIAKMADDGTVLAMDDTADITKAFITFYNARPAGTASTTAP
jgi:Skp family chaperone for outer membrane proteins